VRKFGLIAVVAVVICVAVWSFASWWTPHSEKKIEVGAESIVAADTIPLAPLDTHSASGVLEISKDELVRLMAKTRPLTRDEKVNLDRGCPGFVCMYQRLGLKRWPEEARGTRAYLRLEDALARVCPAGEENFVFIKQAWWESEKPPAPNPKTAEVPLSSITRAKPGWYSFNYAVYFSTTQTYAWINHRDYGFPVNLLKPQNGYISRSPPPLEKYRPAQIYCSTCR
jgi:hypothetical protein